MLNGFSEIIIKCNIIILEHFEHFYVPGPVLSNLHILSNLATQQPCKQSNITTSILQKKPRHNEAESLSQGPQKT